MQKIGKYNLIEEMDLNFIDSMISLKVNSGNKLPNIIAYGTDSVNLKQFYEALMHKIGFDNFIEKNLEEDSMSELFVEISNANENDIIFIKNLDSLDKEEFANISNYRTTGMFIVNVERGDEIKSVQIELPRPTFVVTTSSVNYFKQLKTQERTISILFSPNEDGLYSNAKITLSSDLQIEHNKFSGKYKNNTFNEASNFNSMSSGNNKKELSIDAVDLSSYKYFINSEDLKKYSQQKEATIGGAIAKLFGKKELSDFSPTRNISNMILETYSNIPLSDFGEYKEGEKYEKTFLNASSHYELVSLKKFDLPFANLYYSASVDWSADVLFLDEVGFSKARQTYDIAYQAYQNALQQYQSRIQNNMDKKQLDIFTAKFADYVMGGGKPQPPVEPMQESYQYYEQRSGKVTASPSSFFVPLIKHFDDNDICNALEKRLSILVTAYKAILPLIVPNYKLEISSINSQNGISHEKLFEVGDTEIVKHYNLVQMMRDEGIKNIDDAIQRNAPIFKNRKINFKREALHIQSFSIPLILAVCRRRSKSSNVEVVILDHKNPNIWFL